MNALTRRTWLKSSLLALGGAAALTGARRLAAAPPGPARRLVLVFVQGGWDTTYAIDPKPGLAGVDAPTGGAVKSFGGLDILTDPARPAVETFFADWGDQCAIVRGVSVASVAHPDCQRRIITGATADGAPDVAAIAAATLAPELPAPYLILGRTAFSGPYGAMSARTGTANQIVTLLNPQFSFPAQGAPLLPLIPTDAEEALIRGHVEARAGRELAAIGDPRLQEFLDSRVRGDLLRTLGQTGKLELTRTFATQIALAVQSLTLGLCHSVQLELGGWDTHSNNAAQGKMHDDLFAGLSTLMQSLAAAKLLGDTTVAVVSEMGRTPRLNSAQGKDHWPVTSALLLGAGVAGGKVVGGTTDALDAADVDLATGALDPAGRPITYADLAAGLLAHLGVDPADHILTGEPLRGFSA